MDSKISQVRTRWSLYVLAFLTSTAKFLYAPENDKPWSLSVDFLTDIVEGNLCLSCPK
jgi:hypothetical protein